MTCSRSVGGDNNELRPMAAESDGVPDMVSGDDQPIDLSRTPRKPLRVMPPLIPIKLLRAGYTAQQANKQVKGHDITLASLIKGKSDLKLFQDARSKCGEDISKPAQPVASAGEGSDADDEKEGEEDDEEDGEVSRKRVRLATRRQRLLHRFQAQEFLRQLALQHQQEQAAQKADPAAASKTAIPTQEEENADIRRKQARPLTGKHVRPGTGASPATLLTLRRKIQARQQQHDIKRILE
ncbi:Uncharacterized protein GBIM_01052 [Gryllus bimaculatus]|nr:Uncharacterized protein GBIM_01052 [Gryllus bimaculatus]